MGTRHLIAVVHNGEYKVAQYGQWDGYPTGQGVTVANFIKNEMDLEKFRVAVSELQWITKEECDKVNDTPDWTKVYPHLSRDAGAEILSMVQNSMGKLYLQNTLGFAGDSLFCEYAYVLDLDNEMLEIYKGFNKEPLDPGERFANPDLELEKTDGYFPVKLLKTVAFSEVSPEYMENLEKELNKEDEE